MAIPEKILIPYTEDYYFKHVGRDPAGEQVLGILGAQFVEQPQTPAGMRVLPNKRWYAILHRFDAEGVHVGSDICFAGSDEPAAVDRAREKLLAMKEKIGGVEPCDIEVRLFETEFDGFTFGLVNVSDDEVGERVELVPCDVIFYEPWDGSFDT